ncbi:aminotransferase class V-fold PLP-dependent enzyme [Streptomyces sp. NPDC058000]|uniref:aminotransferase class V-fold PLP-dependent enzyme n=1 Tax=Streptomyces sp. NPDC058000 TaxID=3346299 RepID=UPI0036F12806
MAPVGAARRRLGPDVTGPGGYLAPPPGPADGPVCLDYSTTAAVGPRVAQAMAPYLAGFCGNPSSSHSYADVPRRALAEARVEAANPIGAGSSETVFTAGGSEADMICLSVGLEAADHLIDDLTQALDAS